MKNWFRNTLWFYAFLLLAAVYFAGLFIDLTGDGGLYAAITRQMIESGDWFHLKINGELYDQKPHLLFWLAGAGVKLFGNTNFAFKLFPVLYGWLGFYFTYRLGKLLYDNSIGKLAALLTTTSQIFFLYSFDIHTDIVMQTGVLLALWQLIAYLEYKTSASFIFGFVGIGLTMLAKGPVGAVIPFLVVLLYLLSKKKYKQIFHPKWILGVLISLFVASPTLIYLYKNFGWQGIEFYFITNNFGRISGEYAGSSNDPFFYFYNAIWMFLPWTVFVFFGVFKKIKNWFSGNRNETTGLPILGSVLVFTIILSIAKGKAPNYILMATPVFFVVSAKWMTNLVDVRSKTTKLLHRIQRALLVTLTIFLLGIVFLYRNEVNLIWFIIIFVLSAIAILLASKKIGEQIHKIIFASVIYIGVFNFFINAALAPRIAEFQGARQALEIFEENRQNEEKLYNLHLEEYELFFYAENPVTQIHNYEKYRVVLDIPGSWIYTTKAGYEGILDNVQEVEELYLIEHRNMNEIKLSFLIPSSRGESFKTNYLLKLR